MNRLVYPPAVFAEVLLAAYQKNLVVAKLVTREYDAAFGEGDEGEPIVDVRVSDLNWGVVERRPIVPPAPLQLARPRAYFED